MIAAGGGLASVRPHPRPDAPGHRHGRLVAYLPEPQPRGQISNWKAATSANDSRNGVFCPGGPARDDRAGGRLRRQGRLLPEHRQPVRADAWAASTAPPSASWAPRSRALAAIQPHGHRGGARAAPADPSAADIKAIRLFTGPSGMGYASEAACWHPETQSRR